MKISLLTDAPKYNLALMKISAWHTLNGDSVSLNMPILSSDYRYASILFEKNQNRFHADEYGGPAISGCLNPEFEKTKPDYNLYPHNKFSLGYTFRPCFNTCGFCKVPKMDHPDVNHHSIWEFHDTRFREICLLNNNTFQDPKWKETFEEIWDEDLTVIDENGYDLRLLDDEKAVALKKTKWKSKLHFAWDRMVDEPLILHGLEILKRFRISNARLYVLIGYDTTREQDLYRCQKIVDFGFDPYVMPYTREGGNGDFKRFIDTFMWRKYDTLDLAWADYV